MAVLLTQSWDVIQGKEDEYRTFITSEFLPGLAATGLAPVGGYFVEVGTGPRIIAVQRGTATDELCRVFGETEFKQMVLRLKSLVGHYRAALLEPLGKMKQEDYTIPGGAWKFNQYYDLRPGMKREYGRYVMDEYFPAIESLGYVEVTGGWNVTLGGVSEITAELTFNDPTDIGRMLTDREFRHASGRLQAEFVTNYQNKILRCTERFDEPLWFRL
jgi:hypothetical protein